MRNKILIIGGAGFIGSNILESLDKKKIKADATYYNKKPQFKSKKIKFIYLDLMNKKKIFNLVKKYNFIVMCGGKIFNSRKQINSQDYLNEDVIIHLNTINAVSNAKIKKYLWFSSCTGYPELKRSMNENDFFKKIPSFHTMPRWNSRFIEKVIENYSKYLKTKFITIRTPEVYGKYDNYNLSSCRNIPLLIASSINKKKINYKFNLGFKKNYIYASDLATISLKILFKTKKSYDVFNVCDDKIYSLKKIIKIVEKVLKIKIKINDPYYKQSKNFSRIFSNIKIKKYLRISKIGHIFNSIKYTINWYSKN